MSIYVLKFGGREVGALGVRGRHTIKVEANSEEAAKLKLYDTHEHISNLTVLKEREATAWT